MHLCQFVDIFIGSMNVMHILPILKQGLYLHNGTTGHTSIIVVSTLFAKQLTFNVEIYLIELIKSHRRLDK